MLVPMLRGCSSGCLLSAEHERYRVYHSLTTLGRPGEGSQHYTNSRLLQRLRRPQLGARYSNATSTVAHVIRGSCTMRKARSRSAGRGQLSAIASRARAAAAAASSRDPRVAGLSHSTVTARPAPPAPYGSHPRTLTAASSSTPPPPNSHQRHNPSSTPTVASTTQGLLH